MTPPFRRGQTDQSLLQAFARRRQPDLSRGRCRRSRGLKATGPLSRVDLMQWLCRLVTPPGGVVLDPFAGTGSTREAAWREGFSAVLIEREAQYQTDIARSMGL